jgi:hypothetical protein
MNIISRNPIGRCDAQIDALRAELGAVLADRILDTEAADFLWDSRVRERYLGQHIDAVHDDWNLSEDLSRMAVLSLLDGAWHAGICLVDGEGSAIELVWQQAFDSRDEAEYAFVHAR